MKFGEKLREQRTKRGLLQVQLASAIGVSMWTISNYEKGARYPKDRSIYSRLADFFEVDVNYFLTEDEEFLAEAAEHYGWKGQAQAQFVLEQTAALFAGGELSETDQIAFLHDIQEIFLDSKQRAREKFTPNKYRGQKEAASE